MVPDIQLLVFTVVVGLVYTFWPCWVLTMILWNRCSKLGYVHNLGNVTSSLILNWMCHPSWSQVEIGEIKIQNHQV